ncbi:MAG: hypothetical protein AB7S48_06265 [Bacteroidales bacterium]
MAKKSLIVAIALTSLWNTSIACTTAVISGKATPDGRPILWKHRDTESFNNKIIYEKGTKYNYLGLINSDDTLHQVWAGTNNVGFSIMNSASYNLIPETDSTAIKDLEGFIMKLALGNCATISDFANLLDTLKKPLGVSANFGIIDARGGAGYFETNNYYYKFFDANSSIDAPNGYIIRTNFSLSGQANKGAGYIRFNTATNLINETYLKKKLTPEFFLTEATVSLRQDLTGIDLSKIKIGKNKTVPLRDYIVRYYSSSTVVIQGVKRFEPADFSTMWVKLGFQPASIAFPLWVAAGNNVPKILTAPENQNAKLCNFTLKLKEECFPLRSWTEGENYVQIDKLINRDQTGLIQFTTNFDHEIIKKTNSLFEKWHKQEFDPTDAQKFYEEISKQITYFYSVQYNLK